MMLILKNCRSVGRYALVVVFVMVSGSSTALGSTDAVVEDSAIPLPTKQGYRELALFVGSWHRAMNVNALWRRLSPVATRGHFIKFLVALNLEEIVSLTPEDVIARCQYYKRIHEGYLEYPETMPSYLSAGFVRSMNKVLSLLLMFTKERWQELLSNCVTYPPEEVALIIRQINPSTPSATVSDTAADIPLPTKEGYRELSLLASILNNEMNAASLVRSLRISKSSLILFLVALRFEVLDSLTPEDVISRCEHYKKIHEGYLRNPATMPRYLSEVVVRSINTTLSLVLEFSIKQWKALLSGCASYPIKRVEGLILRMNSHTQSARVEPDGGVKTGELYS